MQFHVGNAENGFDQLAVDEVGRCYNCDNDLVRPKPDFTVPGTGNPHLLEETINLALAKVILSRCCSSTYSVLLANSV